MINHYCHVRHKHSGISFLCQTDADDHECLLIALLPFLQHRLPWDIRLPSHLHHLRNRNRSRSGLGHSSRAHPHRKWHRVLAEPPSHPQLLQEEFLIDHQCALLNNWIGFVGPSSISALCLPVPAGSLWWTLWGY